MQTEPAYTSDIIKKISYSFLDEYKVLQTIGRGATSIVKLIQNEYSGEVFAAKIIKISYDSYTNSRSLLETELECISRIKHKSIVKIFSHRENGIYHKKNGYERYRCHYILMEYCPNGELYDLIKHNQSFTEDITRFFFHEIVDVVEACHTAGVYHGDLKPENILFDDNFNLRLVDFGSSDFKNINFLREYKGTEKYMPPEIRQNMAYDGETSDVFVLGIILFIMYVGVPPFNYADMTDNFYRCLSCQETSEFF